MTCFQRTRVNVSHNAKNSPTRLNDMIGVFTFNALYSHEQQKYKLTFLVIAIKSSFK